MLAIFNLIGYMVLNDIEAAIMFVLIGSLTYCFSRNMIIVYLVPLVFVNAYRYYFHSSVRREGLTNNKKNEKKETENTKEKEKAKAKATTKKSTGKTFLEKGQHQMRTSQGLPVTPLNSSEGNLNEDDVSSATTATMDESFEVGRNKKGYNIDYASTVEDAYDQLNQILGSDGIKRLTNDTQSLMKQQLQLAESMKEMGPMIQGMAPLIHQAKSILSNNGETGGAGLGNLTELAKKFSLQKK
jgi:hypothetical protein